MADVKEPDTPPSGSEKRLGNFIVVSRGNINNAVEKQISDYIQGNPFKPIGSILIEMGLITQEELDASLRNQRIARLAGCAVFSPLSRSELAALSKHFSEISVAPGDVFIMQGDDDRYLYVIAYGLVEVYKIDNAGKEIPIGQVGPGEPVGEMGYFTGGKRTACVRAIEPTQMIRAKYDDLTHYFEHVPRVALAFSQIIEHRRKEIERFTGNTGIG